MASIGAIATRRAKSPARSGISPARTAARPGTLMARREKKRASMGVAPSGNGRPRSPPQPPRGATPLGRSASARTDAATPAASSAGGMAVGRAHSPPRTPRTPVAKATEMAAQEQARLERPEIGPGADRKEVQEHDHKSETAESSAKPAQVQAAEATHLPGGQEATSPPPQGEAERTYRVVCPPEAKAGATIVLDGVGSTGAWETEVDVPPGVGPGDEFDVVLPVVQAGSSAGLEPESEPEPVTVKARPLGAGQSPTFRVAVTKGDNGSFGLLVDADDSGRCIIGGISDMGGVALNAGLLAYKGWLITHLGGQACLTAEDGRDILTAASPKVPVEFVLVHPDAPAAAFTSVSPKPKQDWSKRCWACCCTCCLGVVWMLLLFTLPAVLIISTGRIVFAEHDNVTSSLTAVLAGCIVLLHLVTATALCGNRCRTLLCAWGTFLVGFGAACYGFVHLITEGLEYDIPMPVEAAAPNIAIVGAGTEGLAAAWMLQTAGTKFTLIAEGESFDDAARLVDFDSPGRPAPVRVDTSLWMVDAQDMDLAKIFGGYYSDAANQELEVRRVAPTVAPTSDGWSSALSVNQEIVRFNTIAAMDASDPDIVLWSLDYWLWHHGFSDAFQKEVLEPALHAYYLTQGAVPTSRGPAIAYLRPFANGAWSLRGPGSLVTFEQQGVLGAGLLTAKHTERLGDRPAEQGKSVTDIALIDVIRSSGGYTVRAGEGAEAINDKFDALIINLDASDVAEKVVAAGYLARWALGQVRYATVRLDFHADVPSHIEATRSRELPERPSVFYSDESSSLVTFDVCALTARSFPLSSSTKPSPSQASACTGNRETLVTFSKSPVLVTTASDDEELTEFEDLRQYRILDSWSTFFSVAIFPYFQGTGGLWYTGSWTGFPGLTSAMARGIRAACAAANLNNPETIAAVDNNQLSQGCFTVGLTKAGDNSVTETRFCSERDIFEYLIANYCEATPDGVLPSAMGSLNYPPASWVPVSCSIAGVGAMLILWAWLFPLWCEEPDGPRCLGVFLCPCSKPIPCGCCPRVQSKRRRQVEDEYSRRVAAALKAEKEILLEEIELEDVRVKASKRRPRAEAKPVSLEDVVADTKAPEPAPEPEPEPEPERVFLEF